VERLPGEDDEEFQTLGGFLIAQLQRIPHAGEFFDWDGFRFEVADMDRHRVDKILVQRRPAGPAAPPLST
jgi:putative hemolysin